MICNNNYLADILRVCEIKDLIWVMRFQSPLVYIYVSTSLKIIVKKILPFLRNIHIHVCKAIQNK